GRAGGRLVHADDAGSERGRAVHAVARAVVPTPHAEAEASRPVVLTLDRGRARARPGRDDGAKDTRCIRRGGGGKSGHAGRGTARGTVRAPNTSAVVGRTHAGAEDPS